MNTSLKHIAFYCLLILLLIIAYLSAWLLSSLPQTTGTIIIDGISKPITIARDKYGVPHISAANREDLYFAVGFVHAQDRLWQLEFNRRIGHGRVSEIAGPSALELDKYMRTLGFVPKAKIAFDNLPFKTQQGMQAYADGINHFIKSNRKALPPEFIISGITPTQWAPEDIMVWQKMMWLDLSKNMRHEIARAQLINAVGYDKMKSFFPDYPGENHPDIPDMHDLKNAFNDAKLTAIFASMGGEKPAGYGSNNWVISGEHTTSGKPLLANDPHLGLTTPSIWYLLHLHQRDSDTNLVGVSFPGSPAIILGRNDTIAWGFTNTAPDTQDLFIEKLVGTDAYLTPTGPEKFITRSERIKVKGHVDVVMTVRETRHGPVISDIHQTSLDIANEQASKDQKYVMALQWTALGDYDTAPVAMDGLASIKNFDDFVETASLYLGPEQNMVYADIKGNIGYFAPALVPVRHPDNKILGRVPSPGWDAKYDWQGMIPVSELPIRYNPSSGIIATANEKIVADDYPHYITADWGLPYRGNRIRAELKKHDNHTLNSFQALHSDTISDMVRDIKSWLLAVLEPSPAKDALRSWDANMQIKSAPAIIMERWMLNYQALLTHDELGDLAASFHRVRPQLVKTTLAYSAFPEGPAKSDAYYALPLLDKDISLSWCNNINTEGQQTCTEIANQAMQLTVKQLSAELGTDLQAWQWGMAHTLNQAHRPFTQVPILKNFFTLSAPQAGSNYTINVAGNSSNPSARHSSSFGPSYRGLFDLSNLENSLYIQPTGQSGNPLSKHFDDLFILWQQNQYIKIPAADAIPVNSDVLTLLPPEK